MLGVCRYYGGFTTQRKLEKIRDGTGKESGDQVGGDRRSTRQGVSTRYTCDQTSTRTRDDVRALHLSRVRGMWTEVREKGTRCGPEVRGGGGRTHESTGKGRGSRQRLGMMTGRGPQSMMRREGDRVEGRTKLWGLSWED